MYKKKLNNILYKIRYFTLGIFSFGLFMDIFIFSESNTFFQLFLFFLVIVNVVAFNPDSLFLFRFMGIFLIMTISFLVLRSDSIAEKSAIWAYIFLMLGTIRHIVDLRKEPKKPHAH